jgi:hypothetical protein
MSRPALVAALLVLIAAAVAALYWYSQGVMRGIKMGGPVPLQSVPPRRILPSGSGQRSPAPKAAVPSVTPSPQAPARQPAKAPSVAPAAPKILGVTLSSPVATGGQVVTGTVQTSPDVTAVQAQILGYSSALSEVSTGYFALSYRVPTLPAILRRTYTIVVIARNAAGLTATSSLPITIR